MAEQLTFNSSPNNYSNKFNLLFPQDCPQDDLDFPPPPPPPSCTANDHTLDDNTDQALLPLPPPPSSPLQISYLPTMTHTSLSLASPSPRPSTSTTPDTEFIESVPLKLSDQDSSVEQSPVVESSKTDIVPNVTLNRRNKVQCFWTLKKLLILLITEYY